MSWVHSKKFRLEARKFKRQVAAAEKRWRGIVEAKVKVYDQRELEAFARERGVEVARVK